MNPRVRWAVAASATSMFLVAGNAVSGTDSPFVTELDAALFGPVPYSLQSSPEGWRGAIQRANLAVTQSVAGRLLGSERVRLKFNNGGWIEFQPTPASIAADSLPRLLAIQFPRRG